MQACAAEAQQLNKSIHLQQQVCSILAKTRLDSQKQNKVCKSHGCPPKSSLDNPLLYHDITRCKGIDVNSPRSLTRTLSGLLHQAQGYAL